MMIRFRQLIIALFLLMLSTACSAFQPEPTATLLPTSTNTPVPTATIIPSATPEPTPTSTTAPTPTTDIIQALMPEGEPASEWQGIPIMPGATAGEGDADGYIFAIDVTRSDIQTFYNQEMAKLGREFLAAGTNDAEQTVMLIYTMGAQIASVSMIDGPDGLILVLIVQS